MAGLDSRDAIHKALADVRRAMHEQHPDNEGRLDQLDAHLATVDMVVDHLYDEAETG